VDVDGLNRIHLNQKFRKNKNGKTRLEAFSDGVIAILVLELKVPRGTFDVLPPLWPVFMSYVLSFIYVGIYWNKLQCGCYPSFERNLVYAGFPQERGK
jgi:hypothetical protein